MAKDMQPLVELLNKYQGQLTTLSNNFLVFHSTVTVNFNDKEIKANNRIVIVHVSNLYGIVIDSIGINNKEYCLGMKYTYPRIKRCIDALAKVLAEYHFKIKEVKK